MSMPRRLERLETSFHHVRMNPSPSIQQRSENALTKRSLPRSSYWTSQRIHVIHHFLETFSRFPLNFKLFFDHFPKRTCYWPHEPQLTGVRLTFYNVYATSNTCKIIHYKRRFYFTWIGTVVIEIQQWKSSP